MGSIKGPDNTDMGIRAKVKVVKNKMAPPFRIAEFDVMFNEGISHTGSVVDMGVEHGIIDKKGTWFSYKETRLGQGREAAKVELKKNPKLMKEIEKLIFEKLSPKEPTIANKEPATAKS